MEAGEDPITASIQGTSEVALAVTATTLSILAVFIPVGFMGGMVGQFFAQFGLTMAIAVSISLFIAFTVDPMLSARISKVVPHEERGALARAVLSFMRDLDTGYRSALVWALDHRKAVLAFAGLLFVGSLALMSMTGSEFMPKYDRSQMEVRVDLAPSTGLKAAEREAKGIEATLRRIPEVEHIYTVVGPDGETNRLYLRVLTSPKKERRRSIYEIQDEARALLAGLPGATVIVQDPSLLEGVDVGNAVEIELRGDDISALKDYADRFRLELRRIPGATDINTTYRPGRPELQLTVDRDQAGAAGLSVGQIGITMRMAVAGQVVGKLRDGHRSYDIRVQAREEDRTPEALLSSVLLLSPIPRVEDPWRRGTPVALGNVGRMAYETVPATIQRHDRQRYLRVNCGVVNRPLSDVKDDVVRVLGALPRPAGVDWKVLGDVELARDALGSLLLALGLAVIFVYAILASQFESFIHPFTIMLSLPLAVVGAFATVFLSGWPVGIPTMLGIILLMGLVTKNGILLVDRANQYRNEGLSAREAMLRAGHLRLRPILMTSTAMVFGMLPAALRDGSGAELHRPIALPVIGGLFASTLLTLLVVPVVYLQVERLRDALAARRRKPLPPTLPVEAPPSPAPPWDDLMPEDPAK
jgi:multidrug efflux pump subunit AcrB